MKASFYFSRFVALFLSLSLSLPSPALALRTEEIRNNPRATTGLEETLKPPAAGLEGVPQRLFDATGDLPVAARRLLADILEGRTKLQLLGKEASEVEWKVASLRRIKEDEKSLGQMLRPEGFVPGTWYGRRLAFDSEFRSRFVQLINWLDEAGERDPAQILKKLESEEVSRKIDEQRQTARRALDAAWGQDPSFFGWFLGPPEQAAQTRSDLAAYLKDLQVGQVEPPANFASGRWRQQQAPGVLEWSQHFFKLQDLQEYARVLWEDQERLERFIYSLYELYIDYESGNGAAWPFDLKDPILVNHLLLWVESRSFVSAEEKLKLQGELPQSRIVAALSRLPVLFAMIEERFISSVKTPPSIFRRFGEVLRAAGAAEDFVTRMEEVFELLANNSRLDLPEIRQSLKVLAPMLRQYGFFLSPDAYQNTKLEQIPFSGSFFRVLNPPGLDLTLAGQPVLIVETVRGAPDSWYAGFYPATGGQPVLLFNRLYEGAQELQQALQTGRYKVKIPHEVEDAASRTKAQEAIARMIRAAQEENPALTDTRAFLKALMFNASIHEAGHGFGYLSDEWQAFLTEASFGKSAWLTMAWRANSLDWKVGRPPTGVDERYRRSSELLYEIAGADPAADPPTRTEQVLAKHRQRPLLPRKFQDHLKESVPEAYAYFSQSPGRRDLEQFGRQLDRAVDQILKDWKPRPDPSLPPSADEKQSAAGLEGGTINEESGVKGGKSAGLEQQVLVNGRDVPSVWLSGPDNPTPALQPGESLLPDIQTKSLPSDPLLSVSILTEPQGHPQESRIQDGTNSKHLQPERPLANEWTQHQPSQHNGPRIGEKAGQRRSLAAGEFHLPPQVYPVPSMASTSPAAGLEERVVDVMRESLLRDFTGFSVESVKAVRFGFDPADLEDHWARWDEQWAIHFHLEGQGNGFVAKVDLKKGKIRGLTDFLIEPGESDFGGHYRKDPYVAFVKMDAVLPEAIARPLKERAHAYILEPERAGALEEALNRIQAPSQIVATAIDEEEQGLYQIFEPNQFDLQGRAQGAHPTGSNSSKVVTFQRDLAAGLEEQDHSEWKRNRPTREALQSRRQRLAQRLQRRPPTGLGKWTIATLAEAQGEDRQTIYSDLAALNLLTSDRLELRERRRGTAQEESPAAGLEENEASLRMRQAVRMASDGINEAALTLINRALESAPLNPEIWVARANILSLPENRKIPGALQEALGHTEEALQINPEDAKALIIHAKVLSLLYRQVMQHKKGRKIRGVDPSILKLDPQALREEAWGAMQRALDLTPDYLRDRTVQMAVHVLHNLGMWKEAIAVAKPVLAQEPGTPEGWFHHSKIDHDLAKYNEAKGILEEEVLPYRPGWLPAEELSRELNRDLKKIQSAAGPSTKFAAGLEEEPAQPPGQAISRRDFFKRSGATAAGSVVMPVGVDPEKWSKAAVAVGKLIGIYEDGLSSRDPGVFSPARPGWLSGIPGRIRELAQARQQAAEAISGLPPEAMASLRQQILKAETAFRQEAAVQAGSTQLEKSERMIALGAQIVLDDPDSIGLWETMVHFTMNVLWRNDSMIDADPGFYRQEIERAKQRGLSGEGYLRDAFERCVAPILSNSVRKAKERLGQLGVPTEYWPSFEQTVADYWGKVKAAVEKRTEVSSVSGYVVDLERNSEWSYGKHQKLLREEAEREQNRPEEVARRVNRPRLPEPPVTDYRRLKTMPELARQLARAAHEGAVDLQIRTSSKGRPCLLIWKQSATQRRINHLRPTDVARLRKAGWSNRGHPWTTYRIAIPAQATETDIDEFLTRNNWWKRPPVPPERHVVEVYDLYSLVPVALPPVNSVPSPAAGLEEEGRQLATRESQVAKKEWVPGFRDEVRGEVSGRSARDGVGVDTAQSQKPPLPIPESPTAPELLPRPNPFQSPRGNNHTLSQNNATRLPPAQNFSDHGIGLTNSPEINAAGNSSLNTSMMDLARNSRRFSEKNGLLTSLSIPPSSLRNNPAAGLEEPGWWEIPMLPSVQVRHGDWIRAVAFSPDGKKLATGSYDHTVRLWDASTGDPLAEPLPHGDSVLAVAFSPDGKKLATGSADRFVRLWDASTGEPLTGPLPQGGSVRSVAFSPDGKRLATGSDDRFARLWDASTGEPLTEPLSHGGWVLAVAFSPDGKKLTTGSADGSVRLWEASTGEHLTEPLRHGGLVRAVAFSPDGKRLATGSDDRFARLWDASTGKPLTEPLRHGGLVWAVAFSPDGKKLATGSDDGFARLWDASTGDPLTEPLRHVDRVLAVVFSPDGEKLATASADRFARLWRPIPSLEKLSSENLSESDQVHVLQTLTEGLSFLSIPGALAVERRLGELLGTSSGRSEWLRFIRGVQGLPDSEPRQEALLFYLFTPAARSGEVREVLARNGLKGLWDPQRRSLREDLSLSLEEAGRLLAAYQAFVLERYASDPSEHYHADLVHFLGSGQYRRAFLREERFPEWREAARVIWDLSSQELEGRLQGDRALSLHHLAMAAIRQHNDRLGDPSFSVGQIQVTRLGVSILPWWPPERKEALQELASRQGIPSDARIEEISLEEGKPSPGPGWIRVRLGQAGRIAWVKKVWWQQGEAATASYTAGRTGEKGEATYIGYTEDRSTVLWQQTFKDPASETVVPEVDLYCFDMTKTEEILKEQYLGPYASLAEALPQVTEAEEQLTWMLFDEGRLHDSARTLMALSRQAAGRLAGLRHPKQEIADALGRSQKSLFEHAQQLELVLSKLEEQGETLDSVGAFDAVDQQTGAVQEIAPRQWLYSIRGELSTVLKQQGFLARELARYREVLESQGEYQALTGLAMAIPEAFGPDLVSGHSEALAAVRRLQEEGRVRPEEAAPSAAGLEETEGSRSRVGRFFENPDLKSMESLLIRPDRVEDLAEDFPQLRQMVMEDGHPLGKVWLVPTATLLPGALETQPLKLFVEESMESTVRESLASATRGSVEVVSDPRLAGFIIGSKGFVEKMKIENPSFIPQKVFLVVHQVEAVRSVTAALLFNLESWLASQKDRPAEGWTLELDAGLEEQKAVRIFA